MTAQRHRPQRSKRNRRLAKELAYAKSQGGWYRSVMVREGCPRPGKRRFSDREAAEQNANGKDVYQCVCGEWHLATPLRIKKRRP